MFENVCHDLAKKNIYCSLKHNFAVTRSLFDLHTRQFVASLCVTKGEKQSTQAGWSRCLGSTPWANLGSIDEVAEVKLLILKVCSVPGRDVRYEILQKKKFSHTRQLIAPPCAIKGEKQFFGVRSGPIPWVVNFL